MAFQGLAAPLAGAAAAAGAVGFAAWAVYQRFYVAVPPGKALVLYGRRSAPAGSARSPSDPLVVPRAPRILLGGGAVILPWNRGCGLLSLNPPATEAHVRALHTVNDGRATGWEVAVSVQVKIPTEPDALRHAAEHLLGKTDEEVRAVVRHAVESAVPAILARVPPGQPEPDWERLAVEIEASVAPELVDYGLVIRSVSVTGLSRIAPPTSLAPVASVRSEPSAAAAGIPAEPEESDFALRLARVERGLSIMGAQVVRLVREPPPAALSEPPEVDSVLDAAEPGLASVSSASYDSTGSGRPPRVPRPFKAARSSEEG